MSLTKHIIALFCAVLTACAGEKTASLDEFSSVKYQPQYASGFRILEADDRQSSVIEITDPWQGAQDYMQTLFVARNGEVPPTTFAGETIKAPVKRAICLSSSYVAMFDAVGKAECVVGVSGIDFISNRYVNEHRDSIADVGYDSNIDFEKIVAMRPDVVLIYGVAGEESQLTSKLMELGIPYMYMGDYVENSPLGKAEWLHVIAELTDSQSTADELFDRIRHNYETLAAKVRSHMTEHHDRIPQVMLNTPYRDIWFMPSAESYMVRLIRDAGGDTYTPTQTGTASLPVDLEKAYLLAREADFWLNTGASNTLDELKSQNPRFAGMPAVRQHRVYNCNRRRTPAGGSDFWESGIIHPDIVLRDLVSILHPEIIDADLYYYEQLP